MWVSVFNEDSSMPVQYVVLDGLANPIARAVIPADLRITEIGRDYVLGVRADGDGLQEVVLFRLVRR
jgi:hypothetical protein